MHAARRLSEGCNTYISEEEGGCDEATRMRVAVMLGIFFGIGVILVLATIGQYVIKIKDEKALTSGAAMQVEGSLTGGSTTPDGYGGVSAYLLQFEFHVPAPAKASRRISQFGARVTGVVNVSHLKFNEHCSNPQLLPKDCTVAYVAANPRLNTLVAIAGDDSRDLDVSKQGSGKALIAGILFSFVWCGAALYAVVNSNFEGTVLGLFLGVVAVFVLLSCTCQVRIAMRLACLPGCEKQCSPQFKLITITSLDAPYQKPQPAPLAPVQAAVPGAAQQVMAVQCPPGVAPGQMIQIALPGGGQTTAQVPAGVVPGQSFQVAVPAVPQVAAVAVPMTVEMQPVAP